MPKIDKGAIKQVTDELSKINLGLDKAKLSNRMQSWLNDNSKAAENYGDKIRQLIEELDKVDSRDGLTNVNKQFQVFQSEAKAAGLTGKTFFDSMATAAERLTQYFSIAAMFGIVTREMKQMITTVRELDSAMVELKKVTDETDVTYAKFFENAAVRASRLGAELKDVITASADFARLGYSLSDAEYLADISILYKNVGDNINDISDASASIISTMKAFDVSVEDSMHVVDAFNKVGNEFSISSKEIGDSLQRSASSLSAANNTMEESIGLVTAAYSTIQNSEQVGTALKTISMRLRNTAGELEALNEDAEGAAESITKLQTQLLNLTQGRVDIMDGTDAFKSTYQILLDISDVWDSLSDKAQADITRLVAGVNRGNVFEALMSNMADGALAAEAAINSENSALEENERYLNSIQGRIDLYNTALQKLSATTISSDTVKGVVNIGTTALTILEKIISSLGALPILITAVVSAMSIKNNAGKNVNMPGIYKVIKNNNDTSMYESCAYHTGGKPLNCLVKAKAA